MTRGELQQFVRDPWPWSWDPYVKVCARCDTVIGRFGVLSDDEGLRQIVWWPHRDWDGDETTFRCHDHSAVRR